MKAFLSVAAVAASILTAAPASAVVIGFDDIISTVSYANIPQGYGGLNWNNFGSVHKDYHPDSGYDTGAISGDYTAFNSGALPADITAITDTFSFDGAWFTSAWINDNILLIEGFTDDDNIADYLLSLTLNTETPLFLDVHWTGLHRLRFTTSALSNSHIAMDDLRINEGPMTEVPEPLTIGLLGMGLLGVAGARRRRR